MIGLIVDKPTVQRLEEADRATALGTELLMLASRAHNSIRQSKFLDQCIDDLHYLEKARGVLDELIRMLQINKEKRDEEMARWREFKTSGRWTEPKPAS
jgi:hypothetical protein